MIDPHLQHAEHHSSPNWGWPDALTTGQRDMKDCWQRMISSGFAVFPAHGPWQNITGALYLGFQTTDATMPKSLHATRHAVRSLSVEVLQWLMGRIYRRELGDVKFSSLDIEILRLEKLGCTARETAEALSESPCRIDRAIARSTCVCIRRVRNKQLTGQRWRAFCPASRCLANGSKTTRRYGFFGGGATGLCSPVAG